MLLFEEIVVEGAMVIAVATAAAVFVWAAGTMLIRWFHYVKAERAESGEPAACAPINSARLIGRSL